MYWRDLAQLELDDTYERMCGLEPPTHHELHQDRLDREDRVRDYFPESATGIRMTTAPALDCCPPVTPSRPVSSRVGEAGGSNPPGA